MVYSTTEKINTEDSVFWAVQNSQIHRSENVNNIDFETSLTFIRICHFCVASNIMYFILKICTVVEYIIGYIQIFFPDFFETLNVELEFCEKTRDV
jgi:hypothetical protein